MTLTGLAFPVLGFGRDVGPYAQPGRERLEWFLDEDDFSTCVSWDLEHGVREGMLLVDAAGCCRRIASIERHEQVGSLWMRVLRFLARQSVFRVSQDLVEEPPITFAEVKDRVCVSIAANPDSWRDDEVIAGEGGAPLRDEQELLEEMQDAVRRAQTLPGLINALWDEDLPESDSP